MPTTALEFNRIPIRVGSFQKNVQQLQEVAVYHLPRFHRIAMAHLGNVDDAEDAVQDALLAALAHVNQFRGEAKMSTWLTTIVINSARMQLRKRSARTHLAWGEAGRAHDLTLEEMVADTRPSPEAEYRKREIAILLARAVSRLSPILRRTFELRDVNGLSIRETADLMGVPSGTVKARLARARGRLKEVIKQSTREVVC